MTSRMVLLERLAQWATDQPSAVAAVNEFEAVDFTGLQERVGPLSKTVEQHLGSDPAVVGFAVRNGPHALIAELAIWAAGHTAMALPLAPTAVEAQSYLDTVEPRLLLIEDAEQQAVWLAAAAGKCPTFLLGSQTLSEPVGQGGSMSLPGDDPLVVQFTSGTSGRPKALLFESFAVECALRAASFVYDESPGATAYCSIPQHQAMGRAIALENFWSGIGSVFTNSMAFGTHKKLMTGHGCALVQTNPTYVRLGLQLKLWAGLPSIARMVVGTAAVSPELPLQMREQLPDVRMDIRYGVSEVFGALTRLQLSPGDEIHQRGDVGQPLDGIVVDAPVAQPGPVRVVASQSASAVLANADEVTHARGQDGLVDTGDLGVIDSNGSLALHGRSNVFIKHRGYRIDPAEIEAAMLGMDGVIEAVVVGIADDLDGEKIAVALEHGTSGPLDEKAVLQHCKGQLSVHKLPSRFVQLRALPRKPSGKPDRAAVEILFRNCL